MIIVTTHMTNGFLTHTAKAVYFDQDQNAFVITDEDGDESVVRVGINRVIGLDIYMNEDKLSFRQNEDPMLNNINIIEAQD